MSAAVSRPVLLPQAIRPDRPQPDAECIELGGETMGTVWSVKVTTPPAAFDGPVVRQALEARLRDVCAQMSHWDTGSALMRFNRAEAGSWHTLAPHFQRVMRCALEAARLSDGACDPAAGHWVQRWGFGGFDRHDQPGFTMPDEAELLRLAERHPRHWQDLRWSDDGVQLLQPGGVQLDLGAIAKGFAVDLLSETLSASGFTHHLVEIGGELRGEGMKPDGQPWWVELELPSALMRDADEGRFDAPVLALHGLSVATSGDYRKGFPSPDGRWLSHTIDPRQGRPVRHGLASVTVLHPQCMWADAWSTALSVLGLDEGLDLADRLRLPAFFVLRQGDDLVPYASAQFEAMLG